MTMRLKELRCSKHMTQSRLGMDLDMSQSTVSRYESGEHEPSVTELLLIADYFHVSLDYLLNRTDNPEINR